MARLAVGFRATLASCAGREAIELLLSYADDLRATGVAHVSLFGSLARDELGPRSDIDLVLARLPDRPMTLFSMARAEALLERIFRRWVDLTGCQGLDNAPGFRNRNARDLIDVF